ncbi:alpha/beta hydrolase [Rhodococcoides kyotonense]|uniref:Lysophospholipase, alpha-beta hydrolase superfamily n=1 Tax=Rhodococcoides kyotonense TaxID=398843 RepID=A0A239JDI1_9NOCA|nr:alpha/beta hydrolase [Rhodococcus kyotonensis]SNT03662.1 Lysophospholipase, alpha-beta hydrolase superfamily [Rhodococcus kyotonensis]
MSIDWLEPETNVRGSVVVVTGRGEHAGVYARFARRIAFDGYRVAVVENQPAVTDAVTSADASLPVVVVGSDSGALTALAVASSNDAVTAAVAAGLLVDTTTTWDDELDVRSACPVHRGVLGDAASLDRGVLATEAPTATAGVLAEVRVPTLVVHGASDVVSSVDAVTRLAEELPDARVVLVDGGRHDILNDVSHRSVAAEIVQFLERLRLPGAPDIIVRAAGALATR